MGNVNKLMMSPPGYSGASRKGHLVFDACFESGEYLSPVCPTHEIPIIELLVLYTLIWWWQHTGSFFRSTHTFCPSLEFFCHMQCITNPRVEIRCKQLSARLFRYHFIISHGFIHIRLSRFVLQGHRGKHLTRQHYTWLRYNSLRHKRNMRGDLCSDRVSL